MTEKTTSQNVSDCRLFSSSSGKGEAILLIHGIISDSSFFESCVSYLSKSYQTITYDRRGYGKSISENYTDFSVHAQALDAVSVIKKHTNEPVWLIGNSAGGLIGLELALHFPELLKGLIMIEPSLAYEKEEKQKLQAWNQELNDYLNSGKIKKALPAFSRVTAAPVSDAATSSLAVLKQTYQNLSAFMHGELNEVQHYFPDIQQLKELTVPTAVAVTERGRESIFATSSLSGAQMIGWPVIHIPGFHNVARDMPFDFALSMHGIISGMKHQYF